MKQFPNIDITPKSWSRRDLMEHDEIIYGGMSTLKSDVKLEQCKNPMTEVL